MKQIVKFYTLNYDFFWSLLQIKLVLRICVFFLCCAVIKIKKFFILNSPFSMAEQESIINYHKAFIQRMLICNYCMETKIILEIMKV